MAQPPHTQIDAAISTLRWADEVRHFISTNYVVNNVKCPQIGYVFNLLNYDSDIQETMPFVCYENIRNT
jgi:hypothetical protein